MQIIGIIFNVFFLFILLLMMGFGFLFGMWRKLRSVGGLLIGVLFDLTLNLSICFFFIFFTFR